jgi:osmotically-inducible protein OsmY
MFRRLFGFLFLVGILLLAFYWWQKGSWPVGNLKDIKDIKAPDLKSLPGALKDAATTGSVRTALGLNRELRPFPLEVDTKEGVVSLKGALPTSDLKVMAETVVSAVPNVKQVANGIRVDASVQPEAEGDRTLGERLDDETLGVQVRLALGLRKELDGSTIQVSVLKKTATLTGEASPPQRALAMKVAGEVPGVSHVTDGFSASVRGFGKGKDAAERAIAGNANLVHAGIHVVERGDHLALVGRVKTGAERDLAQLIAERAAGVSIENSLELKP